MPSNHFPEPNVPSPFEGFSQTGHPEPFAELYAGFYFPASRPPAALCSSFRSMDNPPLNLPLRRPFPFLLGKGHSELLQALGTKQTFHLHPVYAAFSKCQLAAVLLTQLYEQYIFDNIRFQRLQSQDRLVRLSLEPLMLS